MGVHQAKMDWTPEKVEELLRLRFQEKWTDSQLAKHFGTTRSVIAGKLSRERIKAGYVPMRRGPLGHQRLAPSGQKPSMPVIPRPRSVFKEPSIVFPLITKGTGEPAILVDVCGCKWPIGEVDGIRGRHIFCNAPRRMDKSYCEEHLALASEKMRAWTADEDRKIRNEWRQGQGKTMLAQVLYRTRTQIVFRARQLGLAV